jgi:hypothetical protein
MSVFVWFENETMQEFMFDVVNGGLSVPFVQYLKDDVSTTPLIEKLENDERFYFLDEERKTAISSSANDLFLLHKACFDPEIGIPRYDIEYDNGLTSLKQWYNYKGNLIQAISYEFESNIFKEIISNGDGEIEVVFDRDLSSKAIVGGKIYRYTDFGLPDQIDIYEKGVLVTIECNVYDGETLSKTIFYTPPNNEIYRVITYDPSGNKIDTRKTENDSNGRVINLSFYDNENNKIKDQNYDYPGENPRLVSVIDYKYEDEVRFERKREMFYKEEDSYLLDRVLLYDWKTENESWVVIEETKHEDEKAIVIKDFQKDVLTQRTYT